MAASDGDEVEDALHASEQRYRSLVDNSLNGLIRIRTIFEDGELEDLEIIETNAAFDALLQLGDVVGKLVSEAVPSFRTADPVMFATYGRVARTGVPERLDSYSVAVKRWFAIAVYRSSVDHVVVVIDDITERKYAERRLVTQNAVSRVLADARTLGDATGELLRVLGEAEDWAFGSLWLVDPTGEALRCVDVWHHPALAAEALAAQTRALTFARGVGGPGRAWETRQPAIIDIESEPGFLRTTAALALGLRCAIEFPIVHGDQVIGIVDMLCQDPRARDPQVLELFGAIGRQIGQFIERTRAEAALRASEERLQQLNCELERRVAERTADLEAFSYSVSHDLRAPLRAVNGYAHLVLDDFGAQLPADAQHLLRTIQDAGVRMGHLIDDLLRFSQLGRQALHRERVDTGALVRDVLDELRQQGGGRPVELRIGELPPCHADPGLLRQVWVNLASNAFKYTRDRSPPIVEVGRTDDRAFYVRDNGVGFDMRYSNRLFRVFERLHTTEFEGAGIGLAIVARIVGRHDGRVWAESELGRGSTFYFTLDQVAG